MVLLSNWIACFQAPESFDVKVGGMTTKCDIFSLGVIIW
jgi:hypothetical protein